MAHEIATHKGKASFAYAGEKAWHGLGNPIPDGASLDDIAELAGMTYEVGADPVRFYGSDGKLHVFDGKKTLFRRDTNVPLSVMAKGYKIVQPKEVVEFFRDLTSDAGYTIETMGVLKAGAVYFALARTGNEAEVANSVHKQFVLLATGCDGTLATTAELTDVRVVCANTLRAAVNEYNSDRVKVRHSTTFDASNVKERLGLLDLSASFDEMLKSYKTLADFKVGWTESTKLFEEILSPNRKANENGEEQRAVRGLKQLEESYVKAPGAVVGTLYGCLQAVTHYVDHGRGNNDDNRTYSALFSQGANLKERAFDVLMNAAAVYA